jgi:tetratricopeptide (TPR) repeat protein
VYFWFLRISIQNHFMKILFLFAIAIFIRVTAISQTIPDDLVRQGIELHDKGDYEGAIKKYDDALMIDSNHFDARYERSYSLLMAKRYVECIAESKILLDRFPNKPDIKNVFVNWGSALDDSGNPEAAIEVFNNGLSMFKDFYLLYFNKGITLAKTGKIDESITTLETGLTYKPLHASSHHILGALLRDRNKIASLLSTFTFLAIEPNGQRAKMNFERMNSILNSNIKKDDNNVTISLDPDVLDTKKNKNKEDDFGSVEFFMTLSAAAENGKGVDSVAKTPADKFDLRLQLLISSLSENRKKAKGFYWTHYVPFFIDMKKNDYTNVFAHIVYLSSGDGEDVNWVKENKEKVDEFYRWMQGYNWDK